MSIRIFLMIVMTTLFLVPPAIAEDVAKPTKEQAVEVLKKMLAALEAKDYDAALTLMQMPEGISDDDKVALKKSMQNLIERKEISADGITKLAAGGKWGLLSEVVPDRAAAMAKKFKVPVEQCYGLFLDPGEAGFYFDGKTLKIIRCDDIGKIGQE